MLPHEPPPSLQTQAEQDYNLYGVVFAADPGEQWSGEEKTVALQGVAAVDRQLRAAGNFRYYQPGYAFRRAFGTITFVRSSRTTFTNKEGNVLQITYGAETFGSKIEFYYPAFGVDALNPNFRNNVVHELGHSFNSATNRATNGRVNPYKDLSVALSEEGELGGFVPREGMEPYPWQQHPASDTSNELFADYFLN